MSVDGRTHQIVVGFYGKAMSSSGRQPAGDDNVIDHPYFIGTNKVCYKSKHVRPSIDKAVVSVLT